MEAERKHTPGPWAWRDFGGGTFLMRDAGKRPVVLATERAGFRGSEFRVNVRDRLVKFDPTHPDARLITAAPDLLEACEAAVAYDRHYLACEDCQDQGMCEVGIDLSSTAQLLLFAAIAKATGTPSGPKQTQPTTYRQLTSEEVMVEIERQKAEREAAAGAQQGEVQQV